MWDEQSLENRWIPLSTAGPETHQRVQVSVGGGVVWATWLANVQVFVDDDNQVLSGITHWRNGPSQTDGLLAPADIGQLPD